MPQMKPMNWILLYLLFTSFYCYYFTFLFYFTKNEMLILKKPNTQHSIKQHTW